MREQMHVRIVPMTGDHLDEVAELERICFTTPWSRNMLVEELQNDCAAFLVALQPEKLTGRLGKFLCPVLLLLVGAMFVGSLVHPVGTYGPTLPPYDQIPAVQGFLTGYQTMDVLAAIVFGYIILKSAREKGHTTPGAQLRVVSGASLVAGIGLLVVYLGLTYLGATTARFFDITVDRTFLVVSIVRNLLGQAGIILFAVVVALALAGVVKELLAFLGELGSASGVSADLFVPLYKTIGIALVVQVGGNLCRDAGESALASVVETAGTLCALLAALPLLRAVLDTVTGLL